MRAQFRRILRFSPPGEGGRSQSRRGESLRLRSLATSSTTTPWVEEWRTGALACLPGEGQAGRLSSTEAACCEFCVSRCSLQEEKERCSFDEVAFASYSNNSATQQPA